MHFLEKLVPLSFSLDGSCLVERELDPRGQNDTSQVDLLISSSGYPPAIGEKMATSSPFLS